MKRLIVLSLFLATIALAQPARERAIAIVKRAAAAFSAGNLAQTITLARQAAQIDPNYPRAYTWLGAAYQKQGRRDDACAAWARVVKLSPNGEDGDRARRGIRELGCGGTALDVKLEGRLTSTAGIAGLAYSSEGAFLNGAGADGAWRAWELPSGRLAQLERGDGYALSGIAAFRDTIAVGSGGGKVRVYETGNGRKTAEWEFRGTTVNGVAWSQNGQFVAVALGDSSLRVLDAKSQLETARVTNEQAATGPVAFSPDNRFLAAGVGTETRVYQLPSLRLVRRFTGDSFAVNAVAWSDNGQLLAGSSGPVVRVWDFNANRGVQTLRGHRLTVSALAFGKGPILASGGYDTVLRFWNAQTGTPLAAYNAHNGQIRGLDFTADGKKLASGAQDGSVCFWRMP